MGGFAAEAGRYHLYVSLACPWAHRTLIYRVLRGLTGQIWVSVTQLVMAEDRLDLRARRRRDRRSSGRETVLPKSIAAPKRATPAASPCRCSGTSRRGTPSTTRPPRSSGCSTARSTAFARHPGSTSTRRRLRDEIDALNERIYATVNNGVYRRASRDPGGLRERSPAVRVARLARGRPRRASLPLRRPDHRGRLAPVDDAARFDPVYVGHFKCNLRRIVDYPHLWDYTRELYQTAGVAETVDFRPHQSATTT